MNKLSPVVFILLVLCAFFAKAQPVAIDAIQTINQYIKAKEFKRAEALLNEQLQAHSTNPDLWITKANLDLNKFSQNSPTLQLTGNNNEDIYDNNMGFLGDIPLQLPLAMSDTVLLSLKKALSLAPLREDIHQGLCYIYSISNRPTELMLQIHQLYLVLAPADENVFMLADYARNLIERNHFEEGMLVYAAIYDLYPDNGGILSDMAGEYYNHGDMKSALVYAKMAAEKQLIDEMTFGNIFFLAGLNEDLILASDALQKQCAVNKSKEYLVYDALLALNKGSNPKGLLTEYLKSPSKSPSLAKTAQLISSPNFSSTLAEFDSLMQFNLQDPFKLLVCTYFIKIHPQAFAPTFQLAELYTFNKLYAKADSLFNTLDNFKMDSIQANLYHMYAGWSAYKLKNDELAAAHFTKLIDSHDFWQYSMGCYFMGVIHERNGNEKSALQYYKFGNTKQSESKYAMFCSWKVKDLKQKN